MQHALYFLYIAIGVFFAGWIGKMRESPQSTPRTQVVPYITRVKANLLNSLISSEVSCWILTGERQTAVIRSKYVQVLLNQDMSFFDTYGNNGDIVSQVLSDVLLIQSALSEKVCSFHAQLSFCYI